MPMQSYTTAPGRNTAVASGPPQKGLIEKEMMMPKMPMKKAKKKPAKKRAKK